LEDIVLDVHLPLGKLYDIKEIFLHLFIITIGLLIALSLEGLVEYELHRHLAREAEAGLRVEIANNEHELVRQRQQIEDGQKLMGADLKVLAEMRADPHAKRGPLNLMFSLGGFDDMSWKTAQSTGAIAYMPYKDAQKFSDIYDFQDVYLRYVLLDLEDIGNADSLFISHPDDWVPSTAQIDTETERIGKVAFNLSMLRSLADNLDNHYKEFDAGHK
jgi:hypothetical protein